MMDKRKITIRIGRNNLSFTMLDATNTEQPIVYTPYVVKAGITMAVNLRQAFKSDIMIEADVNRADVLLDTPQMLVPIEQFEEDDIKTLFDHAFPAGQEQRIVRYNVLPNLKSVCLFAINKDLNNVINDQFQQNRFKYCNSFEVSHAYDALYFLLYVWKQLHLEAEHDELHIVGDIPEQTWLVEELKRYLRNAYVINPAADFQQSPITEIAGMPYDLMTLIVKGR